MPRAPHLPQPADVTEDVLALADNCLWRHAIIVKAFRSQANGFFADD